MLEHGDFRKNLKHFINDYDSYTKEELYCAFLQITERYLDEMVTTMNYEKVLTENLGEEKANELIETISLQDPVVRDLDHANALEDDPKERLFNLLAHIEFEFGVDVDNKNDDSSGLPEA